MTRSVLNALKSVAVLTVIAIVCVGALAVCNMFFPKYVPTLDRATAKTINEKLAPTGVSSKQAFDEKYIIMLQEDDCGVGFDAYNKKHKSDKAQILAVYGEPKGVNAGAFIIESVSAGNDGDVIMLTAYNSEAVIMGVVAKKHVDSYWNRIPDELFESLVGQSGDIDLMQVTGATHTRDAIYHAVSLASDYAVSYGTNIRTALSEAAKNDVKGARA